MKYFAFEVAPLVFGPVIFCCMAVVSGNSQTLEYAAHSTTPHTQQPPSYLHPCHRRHKRFNLCVKTTLQNFFNAIAQGSKELDTPPIDPMRVPHMELTEGSGDVSLNLKFKDVTILGLGNTKVVSVRSNLDDNKLEVTVKYPYLDILGQYAGQGSVKTFPIVGDGDFSFNMTDVSAAWIIYLAESSDVAEKHLIIDQFLIDIIPVEISAKFGDAIDGDNALGSAINGFFNENSQELFKITKPKITENLSLVFTSFANQVLSRFSSNTLLPP